MEVTYNGKIFKEALLDGGSGVNILLESVYLELDQAKLEPAPFQLKMADQRRLQPLGILKDQAITVAGLTFRVNFVVLKMQDQEKSYSMLLGRPWFRVAKVSQDWGKGDCNCYQGEEDCKVSNDVRESIETGLQTSLYSDYQLCS